MAKHVRSENRLGLGGNALSTIKVWIIGKSDEDEDEETRRRGDEDEGEDEETRRRRRG